MALLINSYFTPPPITPSSLAGLVRWYKADSFALADGTAVGGGGNEWIDQSVSGANLTQASAGNRPVFHTNVFGAMPSVRFAAASSLFLLMPSLTLAGNFTIVAVITSNVGVDSMIFGNTAGNYQIRLNASTLNRLGFYAGADVVFSDAFATAASSVGSKSWRRLGNDITFRENTIARGTVPDGGAPDVIIDELGGTSFGYYVSGDVAEICVYSQNHADADLDNLYNSYLKPRWGLP